MTNLPLFAILAILLSSIFAQANFFASAQEVIIKTSADKHDMKFFGEGILQVVITDENASDDNDDSISVEIDAKSDDNSDASSTFEVPNTSAGSQKFEFFLVHAASQYADGIADDATVLDPINSDGFDDPADGFDGVGAPLIRFGTDAGTGVELDTEDLLYEEISFEIHHDDLEATVNYEETFGSLQLDRESYGSGSFVYVWINDQDANLNPFERDEFTVDPDSEPNDDLLELQGRIFTDPVTFRETGDNTAVFEGKYKLGDSIVGTGKALILTLKEKANYEASLDADENDSNVTDELNFFVGNTAGSVTFGDEIVPSDPSFSLDKASYAIGEEVNFIIKDPDANRDTDTVDTIQVRLSSETDSGGKQIVAQETGEDTGEFAAVFILGQDIAVAQDDKVIIRYTDRISSDGTEKDFFNTIDVRSQKVGIDSTTVAMPSLKDFAGKTLTAVNAFQQVMISTTVENNNDVEQDYAVIIEVRDSNDITQLLEWQTGTLNPDGTSIIGISWMPEVEGEYEARVFVLSEIKTPEVLSEIAVSELNVI